MTTTKFGSRHYPLLSNSVQMRMVSPSQHTLRSDSESPSSSDIDDGQWDDWISDSNAQQQCKSLFDDMYFPTVQAAAAYDKETHKFVLDEVCKTLCEHLVSFI